MPNNSARRRPIKAPKGRKKIAQGNAMGKRAPKKPSRGLDARASNSDLGKSMWAVVADNEILFNGTYGEAFAAAERRRDLGISATVMTDAAANRIHGFNELAGAQG